MYSSPISSIKHSHNISKLGFEIYISLLDVPFLLDISCVIIYLIIESSHYELFEGVSHDVLC